MGGGGGGGREGIAWPQCIACKYTLAIVSVATLRIGSLSKCHVTGGVEPLGTTQASLTESKTC